MFIKLTSFNMCNSCIKKKNKNVLHIFHPLKLFHAPCYVYPTNLSLINFSVPQTFLKARYTVCNTELEVVHFFGTIASEKKIDNFLLFKKKAKEKIMEL